MSDAPTTPQPSPGSAEFWAEQARELADDLNHIESALDLLRLSVPRAIQQAADLGMMREQHDTAGLRMALSGDMALNQQRDERQDAADHAIVALRGELALLRHMVAAIVAHFGVHVEEPPA